MFLGGRFIKRQAQRQIVKNESVRVTHMTPWFPLFSALLYIWNYRRLPGGFIGILMIASGIFVILDQYIVNSYIFDTLKYDTCEFKDGLVADWGASAASAHVKPAPLWSVSFLAINALLFANATSNIQGVYSKVDYSFQSDRKTFRPREEDVLGNWICSEQSVLKFSPNDLTSLPLINATISRQNFLYQQASAEAYSYKNDTIRTIMAWSADQGNNNSSPVWNMNATIGTQLPSSLQATNYHCTYVPKKKTWKAPIMPMRDTLFDWKDLMLGQIVENDMAYTKFYLEVMLNAMSMVGATQNQAFNSEENDNVLAGLDTSYGCVFIHPVIHHPVFIVLFILIAIILALLAMDIYNLIMNCISGRNKIIERMPFDVMDWQLSTMQNLTGDEKLNYRDVKDYEYLNDRNTEKYMARKIQPVRASIFFLCAIPSYWLVLDTPSIAIAPSFELS